LPETNKIQKTEAEIYVLLESNLTEILEILWDKLTPDERKIAKRLLPKIVEAGF
jgi:hypothetical protein